MFTKQEFESRLPEIKRTISLLREERAASLPTVEQMSVRVSTDTRILERVRRTLVEKTRKGVI